MEFAESSKENSLLFVVGESQSLDGLGGMNGSSFDGNFGVQQFGTLPFVVKNLRGFTTISVFMSKMKLVLEGSSFLGFGLNFLGGETELRGTGRLVV